MQPPVKAPATGGAPSLLADEPRSPAPTPCPSSRPFGQSLAAMTGIGIVNMLVALDQTTVSTALPQIVATLGGFEWYTWIATAYLLTSLITVPVFGRLGDYYGRKPFVVGAVATFTVASVLCASAPNMATLVAARALQGIGAGMMTGTAFASIPDLFPAPLERARWQVVLAAAYGIGTAAGPSLGGWLTDRYGWRSTFLINLPVGVAALYFTQRYLPRVAPASGTRIRIDIAGALTLSLLLACLLFVFGNELDDMSMQLRCAAIASLPVLVTLFVRCERRATVPLVPLELLGDRRIVTLLGLSFLTGAVMFSAIFYAPLLLQSGFGLSATAAGQLSTPLAGSIAIGSLLNTAIVTRVERPAIIVLAGFSMLVLACYGLSCVALTNMHALLIISLSGAGVGLGLILNNVNIFTQEIAGKTRVGIATSLIQSTRMIGGMVGLSALGAWVSAHYKAGTAQILNALGVRTLGGHLNSLLEDPQLLIDPKKQSAVIESLAGTPFNGQHIIDVLRGAFSGVLHTGFQLAAGAAFIALLAALTILEIRFSVGQKDDSARHNAT
ncbi:major facilitator superfamily protein [Burkholderia contaminans]|uniref:MFS transporter n=1 Tax=Burkholderia contaminans TaxID=488447 RepID=UPI000F57A981|nr:MFS transporter [Burkholderia contaminans]RQT25741.1 MFS transporter [Burkholderia contaminans]VWD34851.1 major facilitator superfamily protein [Burkholderia contaminans]